MPLWRRTGSYRSGHRGPTVLADRASRLRVQPAAAKVGLAVTTMTGPAAAATAVVGSCLTMKSSRFWVETYSELSDEEERDDGDDGVGSKAEARCGRLLRDWTADGHHREHPIKAPSCATVMCSPRHCHCC